MSIELLKKEYEELVREKKILQEKENAFNIKLKENKMYIKNGKIIENKLLKTIEYDFVIEDRYVGEVGMMYDISNGYISISEEHFNLLTYLFDLLYKEENINSSIEEYLTKIEDKNLLEYYNEFYKEKECDENDLKDFIVYTLCDLTEVDEFFFYSVKKLDVKLLNKLNNKFYIYKDEKNDYVFNIQLKEVEESEFQKNKYINEDYHVLRD